MHKLGNARFYRYPFISIDIDRFTIEYWFYFSTSLSRSSDEDTILTGYNTDWNMVTKPQSTKMLLADIMSGSEYYYLTNR